MMSTEKVTPKAFRVDDDDNLGEKDLKRSGLFGEGKMKSTTDPGMEGQGMGGQAFGENNITPAGNDKDNPPQNADEHNAYFSRTQPAEEHPENSNFVVKEQEGGPGKDEETNITGPQELADQQTVGEDNSGGHQKHPNPQQPYREGTADDDGEKK